MTLKRWMLSRRRLDGTLLALVVALLALGNPIAKWLLIFFVGAGLNVGLSGHRTWRYAPLGLTLAVAAYGLWMLGLSLWRGEPFLGNRELAYVLVQLALLFLPLGTVLVPRPLDAMILGARTAIVAMLVLTVIDFALDPGRVDIGLNEAIFAFLAAMTGLIARLRPARPQAMLPDGRFWFYLTFIPVLLSGTRSAWFLYGFMVVLDLVSLVRERETDRRRALVLAGAGLCATALLAIPAASLVSKRFASAWEDIERYRATGLATGSLDTRLAMWAAAGDVLADHPLVGVGGLERMSAVAAQAPANAAVILRYEHLHNLVVDVALMGGLVGVVLLVAIFAVFARSLLAWTHDRCLRESAWGFLVLVATVGSFQGVLLNEWMIVSVFSFMLLTLAALKRDRLLIRGRIYT